MDKQKVTKLKLTFDDISHLTEEGVEFWYARELQEVLGYAEWRNFNGIIEKAKISCDVACNNVLDHFVEVNKMVEIGSSSERGIADVMLTRYACYLIAQNGDPRKSEIAFAQAYFAVQTRKQEIIEERIAEINRLQLREKLKENEKLLSQNIFERGVDEKGFGRIRSKGDTALFGGYTTVEMKEKYNIKSGPLADRLPSVTLAAKSLATEMTNLNIDEKDLYGEYNITEEHVSNNASVRKMLEERDIIPENLPPEEDIKKIERRVGTEKKKLENIDDKLPKAN